MYNNYTHNNYHQFCIVSQGRKKNVARQGLEPGYLAYRASTQPLSYRATRSTGYKLVPTHWPPNVTGAEKERGPIGTRTQGLSLTVRALYH